MKLNDTVLSRSGLDMLAWVSERNLHIPLEDLAFLLGIDHPEPQREAMALHDYPYEPIF